MKKLDNLYNASYIAKYKQFVTGNFSLSQWFSSIAFSIGNDTVYWLQVPVVYGEKTFMYIVHVCRNRLRIVNCMCKWEISIEVREGIHCPVYKVCLYACSLRPI